MNLTLTFKDRAWPTSGYGNVVRLIVSEEAQTIDFWTRDPKNPNIADKQNTHRLEDCTNVALERGTSTP